MATNSAICAIEADHVDHRLGAGVQIAFGVDQSELGEGLFPIGGDLAFDEAA
jgi:hypothetical protein